MKTIKKISAILLAAVLILTVTACAKNKDKIDTKSGTNAIEHITLSLDYTPNTNHTGIYVALAKGYYKDKLFDVEVVQPPEGDAVSACSAGQVEFAIGFQDLLAPAFSSATPMEVTAVAALLQHNTGEIMAKKGCGMDRPKGLEGNDYLTWDSPIELAMMKSVVEADGGDWSRVNVIPNAVTNEAQDIAANPTHAIWAYHAWGVINAQVSGVEVDTFNFKDIDPIFDYYSPVLLASNEYIAKKPERVTAFLEATKKGYEYAIEHPEEAAQILIDSDDTGSLKGCEELVFESQKWISEQYKADCDKWGYIEPSRWNGFYNWLNDNELVENKIAENTGFTNEFLG